jgi:hypothetical protein
MAIVLVGKTKCAMCNKVLSAQDNIMAFAPLAPNENDPLHVFNDAAFHANCFYKHPLSKRALAREKELQGQLGPGRRFCMVCEKEIDKPEEYFTLSLLTEDERHPLHDYNYAQLHLACLASWADVDFVYRELEQMRGTWKGPALDVMLEQMKPHLKR